jgi:succinate dehydrogenase / fumarate reductase cytochrome b subunit
VVEEFKEPHEVIFYLIVMVLLGIHLRHGFWSAFQSLGALNPKLRGVAYSAGAGFAVLIAIGFLILPVFLYLFASVPASGGVAVHP